METFRDHLDAAREGARRLGGLALVPFVSTFLAWDNVRRAATTEGFHGGVAFRFPATVIDLWTFVSLPAGPPGLHVSPTLWLAPLVVLVQSALAAGYLGSVHQGLADGRYDFGRNVRRYVAPLFVYGALAWGVGLVTVGLGLVPPLLVLAVPAFLVLNYLFYATPYLIVARDASLGEALSESYRHAVAGGEYVSFAAGYFLFVLAASIPATILATNFGIAGVVVGAVVTAPVALVLTAAATSFVDTLDPAPA